MDGQPRDQDGLALLTNAGRPSAGCNSTRPQVMKRLAGTFTFRLSLWEFAGRFRARFFDWKGASAQRAQQKIQKSKYNFALD